MASCLGAVKTKWSVAEMSDSKNMLCTHKNKGSKEGFQSDAIKGTFKNS